MDNQPIYHNARELLTKWLGEPVGEGRHRVVFRYGAHVLKLPTEATGIWACEDEVYTTGERYARGVLHPISEVVGLPVVWQEWVEHTGSSSEPDWTWSVDCGQVGLTMDGRHVAYDWDNY